MGSNAPFFTKQAKGSKQNKWQLPCSWPFRQLVLFSLWSRGYESDCKLQCCQAQGCPKRDLNWKEKSIKFVKGVCFASHFLFPLSQMSTMLQKNILGGGGGEVVTLKAKNLDPKRESYLLRQFMSLIWLLIATEKQVQSGQLYMRPLHWHLKNHWHVQEVLEKIIPLPRSLHPHLDWWLDKDNVLWGQQLHPLCHALQLFTDASNEGWGAHLGDCSTKGIWSQPESKLHINFLEGSFSGPQGVQAFMQESDSVSGHGQHHSCCLHKQGWRYEIRLSLCPPLETALLVQS